MEEMRKQQESMAGGPAAMLTGGAPTDMGSLLGMLTGEQPKPGANGAAEAVEADPYDFAAGQASSGKLTNGNAAPRLKSARGKRSK
jgi:hypothetical protein